MPHFSLLFVALLFLAGCAQPGPALRQPGAPAAPGPGQVDVKEQRQLLAGLERADAAFAAEDYRRAAEGYAQALATGGAVTVPAAAYYRYGVSLSRTGAYAEAIEQLKHYTSRVKAGQYGYAEAMAEWSLAQAELGKLVAQQQAQAEQQQRLAAQRAAREALPAVPEPQQQQLQAEVAQRATRITEPLTGMELLLVAGGCYPMGDQFGDADEKELSHEVCVDDFYLGASEVTQGQWQQLMGYNPAYFQNGDNYPVENLSWQEVQAFLELLDSTGAGYRLPTEAEWEYAARSGGKKQRFSGGDDADAVAWYEANSGGTTHPVGQKQANGLGLYDMSGNVSEWCQDYHARGYYQISPRDNPPGPAVPEEPGERRVRGGDFNSSLKGVRSSSRRVGHEVDGRGNRLGFRVALPGAAMGAAQQ